MANDQQFKGKVALVTGAAAGIGAATAIAFSRQGASVILSDINPLAEKVAEGIRKEGGEAIFYPCDVSDSTSVATLFSSIKQHFPKLDIAFNNAGIDIESGKLADGEEQDYDSIMDINVKGVWLCMKHEINSMLETGGGAIVNTASIAGLGAAPAMSIYAASKHAVIGLTKSAAIEYARRGIRVNAVCPAVIDTDMYRRAIQGNPKKAQGIGTLHPVGRIGTTDEIVSAVFYLCSATAGFTTGVALPVDGGSTAI